MNELEQKIAAETAQRGALSFARFMELALYCPVYGYYEKEADRIGRQGDFFTSSSVGPLFGELLALRFAEWFDSSTAQQVCQLPALGCHAEGQPGPPPALPNAAFLLVEAGAHRGDLALDILRWLHQRQPAIFKRLNYRIIEPSERRRQWQRKTLQGFEERVGWAPDVGALEPELRRPGACQPGGTVLFCNELLDAMPVHRLGWDAAQRLWFEWGVACQHDRFVWTRLAAGTNPVQSWLAASSLPVAELSEVLPDGYTLEVSPAAIDWWHRAAATVNPGRLVAIDYGTTAEELLMPERPKGTLRAYSKHRLSSDPLATPGEQDLTAHVNFTAIEAAGLRAGARTEEFVTQEVFLTGIASRAWDDDMRFGPWTQQHTRQFQTLVHPEHLGRAFRVLVQSRCLRPVFRQPEIRFEAVPID